MTITSPELVPSSPNIRPVPAGGRLAPYLLFSVQQALYTEDLQRNQVSSLEPSYSISKTLPPGHRGPHERDSAL
ncbi:hypothetical protein AVEN_176942-1 [Araneus ventricosus]|uniref:Uncharacterized protein n=1 Tax=Araneus ventricosus TaxID=182803 RepID=A0A4Y2K8L6_ARAVE|nr:hypothetical protein AVEN_176942-1 [Araneus ventricosus]